MTQKTDLGIPATHPHIQHLISKITHLHHPTRRVTFNKMGIDTISTKGADAEGWFLKEFVNYACTAQKPLLDLGAGFCGASLKALEQGATVIANDLSMDNLLFGIQNTAQLDRLYLNTDRFPEMTDFPDSSLSGVFAHRILHFLSGEEIDVGLSKIAKWLHVEAKLFIVVLCPQNQTYRDWALPLYDQKWKEGHSWPGEYMSMKKAMPVFAESNPEYLHLIDDRPLKRALEKNGFCIEKSAFIPRKYQKEGIEEVDPQVLYSVIAVKK